MAVDLRVVGHAATSERDASNSAAAASPTIPGTAMAESTRAVSGMSELADVAALGPGICRQLLLVQRLQRVQRFLRGEARARRCVALQPGEVVELGRAVLLLPALDLQDRALRPDDRMGAALGLLTGLQLLAGETHVRRPADRALHLEEGDRLEVADRAGPLDDQRQRRGLDAAGGQARAFVEAR